MSADASGYYVPPPRAPAPSQGWSQRSQLPIDHVIAGSFESAARLLHQQVGSWRAFLVPIAYIQLTTYIIANIVYL